MFVKELYISDNGGEESLTARVYKGSSTNYFQIFGNSGVLFQTELLSDKIVKIDGTIKGYVVLQNSDKFVSTTNLDTLNSTIYDVINSPAISSYINNDNLQNSIVHTYVVDKNGNGDYTSLTECIEEAEKYMDSVVHVNAGVYDIEKEFKDLYGEDYFNTYTVSVGKGIVIKNRINIIFSSSSKVVFNYTGNNQEVQHNFSPFNSGILGFTLENLTLEASGCRYAIHDERGVDTDSYINSYINCNIYLDNTNNTQGYDQCIGGGLGTNGYVVVDGCLLNTKKAETNYAVAISYHNTSVASAKSHVVIKNSYIPNYGKCRFGYYGESTEITKVELFGNYFGRPYSVVAETVESDIVNMEVTAWNNEVLHP